MEHPSTPLIYLEGKERSDAQETPGRVQRCIKEVIRLRPSSEKRTAWKYVQNSSKHGQNAKCGKELEVKLIYLLRMTAPVWPDHGALTYR